MTVSATISIKRFDPSVDNEPYIKDYQIIDFDTTIGPLSVLKALHWINNNVEPIAYDYNCRRASCGLCGMMVNGAAKLACMTQVNDGDEILLEPLSGFPVIRDLIVDNDRAHQRFVQASVNLKTSSPDAVCKPIDPPEKWWDELAAHNLCRECMLCYASCQALQQDNMWNTFAGPGALAQVYGKHISGIDESDRVAQAVELGVFQCVQCGMCSTVCPARIPTAQNNKNLMDEAIDRGIAPIDNETPWWPMI